MKTDLDNAVLAISNEEIRREKDKRCSLLSFISIAIVGFCIIVDFVILHLVFKNISIGEQMIDLAFILSTATILNMGPYLLAVYLTKVNKERRDYLITIFLSFTFIITIAMISIMGFKVTNANVDSLKNIMQWNSEELIFSVMTIIPLLTSVVSFIFPYLAIKGQFKKTN